MVTYKTHTQKISKGTITNAKGKMVMILTATVCQFL